MKFPSYLPSCIQVGRRGSLGWGAARRPWENDGVHNGFIMRLCVNNGFSNGFNQWLIMVLSILFVKNGSQNGLRLFLLHPVFQTWGEILPLKLRSLRAGLTVRSGSTRGHGRYNELDNHNVGPPFTMAKLVNITPITMVYYTYKYGSWGESKPTFTSLGGHHLV